MYFNEKLNFKFFSKAFNFSLFFSFCVSFSALYAQTTIFSNAITGSNPNTSNPYISGQVVSTGITVSGIGMGSGITPTNANDRYNASGWNSNSLGSSDYFEWTITPSNCFEIDFNSFIYSSQVSNSEINRFRFRSSIDNFTNDIGTSTATGTTISLTDPAYQNITTPITFRMYAFGSGTVNSGRTFSINDFQFTGTISSGTPQSFPSLTNGDYVWTGSTSQNWTTDANWSVYNSTNGSLTVATADPDGSNLNVIIPPISTCNTYGVAVVRNCLLNNDRTVKNITILSNGQLTVDQDGDSLSVFANWTNNGVFNHNNRNAKVDFKHTGNIQTIGGTSQTQFYNLEISNNNSNNVVLNQSVSVANNFKFDGNRKFELGNNSLTFLGNSNISGANNSRYFVTNGNGTVNRVVSNGNVIFPVGISLYNPCTLSNSGTSDVFSVRVIDNVTQDGSGIGSTTPAKCVKRTWMISEATTGGSNVTMKLQWNGNNSEHINGFVYNPGFMYIAHHNGSVWEDKGFNGQSNAANAHFLTQANITSFSPFSIADASTPLPVELTSFTASCQDGKGVNVAWSTASEHNSSYFDVLKSEDGHNWRSISIVSAAGNSVNHIDYSAVDAEKMNGTVYYKLMQYDIDGKSKEYGPVSSNCNYIDEMLVKTYPNPSSQEFYVEIIAPESTTTVIAIVDAHGKSVYSRIVDTDKGTNLYTFEDLNILPGMYYIQISNDLTTPNVVKHSFR